MKAKRMNNPPPEPTLEELRGWSTPRLLRYFKTHRNSVRRPLDRDDGEDAQKMFDEHEARMSAIRHILNGREHVSA